MNREMLSALFLNTTDDLIFLLKVNEELSFIYESANPAYFKFTGFTEEIIGQAAERVLPAGVVDFVMGRFREAMEQRSRIKYEEDVIFSGMPLIAETTLVPFYDHNGKPEYLLGVTRNITDKRSAERKLEESQQRYRSLFYNNPDISFALDLAGTIVEINDAVEPILGYKPEELLVKSFLPLVHPTKQGRAKDVIKELLQGSSSSYELTVIHKDGREVDLQISASPSIVNGSVIGVIGIAADVTARKKAFVQLGESEQRYRALVQQSPDAIVIHDNGYIIFCNEAAARLVGAEHPDELLGVQVIQFIHPDLRYRMIKAIDQIQRGEKTFPTFETKIVRIDGKIVDVEGTNTIIEYNGKMILQGVLRDITKRKLEEERLHKLSQLDGLTNIANRRYFDTILAKELNRAKRNKTPISLILFDIDFFKPYNDFYGHIKGDDCLKKIAISASTAIKRPGDVIARYGGEEFVVLLPETDCLGARHVAERLRQETETLGIPHTKSQVSDKVTISLGVASIIPPLHYETHDLIHAADRALYAAKRKGKNRVEVSLDLF
ncbi:PAS domain S-box protein [Paenibacillus thermotolerans]|uniref:PAS domain S-box protein n=1 Tax=Paenibacillus thermotolerans TaxID=3027807 RepID=UPI0023689135|nr:MULTISPECIES: PAS domain S-box protein [unclassified Paenibacillus]